MGQAKNGSTSYQTSCSLTYIFPETIQIQERSITAEFNVQAATLGFSNREDILIPAKEIAPIADNDNKE